MELATPLIRRGPRSALISVARIDGHAVARTAGKDGPRDLDGISFLLAGTGIAVKPAGGGGTSYDDGGMWLHSDTFRRVDGGELANLRDLRVTVDAQHHELQPAELGTLRTADLPASVRVSSEGTQCPGCGADRSHARPRTFCDACMHAIDRASVLGATVTEPPIRVVPVGTSIGPVDGAEITVLDIEIYPQLSLLRTWWVAEAAAAQPLQTLRCPLDRRLDLHTSSGHHVIAPGSSSRTDGRSVETQHRIVGAVDPDTRTLRLSVPGAGPGEIVIDLPG